MQITWDEPKRRSNLDKHGLDFADLTADFFRDSHLASTREGRILAIGTLNEGAVLAVVYRPLGSGALAVISMRRASWRERKAQ